MLDFSRIIGFDWDAGNARKSVEKHGATQQEAGEVFADSRLLVMMDQRHSGDEPRFHAYGMTRNGRRLHVSFTLRGEGTLLRVISARDMSRREKARYEQEA